MRRTYFFFLLLLAAVSWVTAQDDALVVAPDIYKLIFENDYVRVVQAHIAPHKRSALHRHAGLPVVLVGLSHAVHVRFFDEAGKTREINLQGKPGRVNYSPGQPLKHQVENLGDQPVHEVRVELKAAPASAAVAQDPVQLDPKHNKVELENARVRMVRVNYGPKENGVMADRPARVIVCVSDLDAWVTFPDGRTEERHAKAGQALWAEAGRFRTENLSEKPFEAVVVELKGK